MVSALCVALVVVAQNNKEELAEVSISNGFYSPPNFEWILFTPKQRWEAWQVCSPVWRVP